MAKAPTDEFGTSFGDYSAPATPLTKAQIDTAVAAVVARVEAAQTNEAARRSTEAWASPFSTAFGGTAASTTLDAVREYASPFSTVFGGTAPATPYTPSQFVNPTVPSGTYTGSAAAPVAPISSPSTDALNAAKSTTTTVVKPTITNAPTTAREILLQALLETGMPADVAEASLNFVQSVIDDGMTQENAIKTLYNFKEFTTKAGVKLTSPFYAKYTSLGEGLTGAEMKSPKELMNFALTTEKLIKSYGFSDKFYSYDSLKKYVQNNVSATDLEPRLQAARLKTTEADPTYVAGLQKLGYISGAQDLADFFLDPTIGKQQLEANLTAADFAQASLQRAEYGITFNPNRIKNISAQYAGVGNSAAIAAAGYERIAETLMPEYNLATMYEQPRGTILNKEQQAEMKQAIQTQLEQEQFTGQGLASQQRKKKLTELAVNAFQGGAGRSTAYNRQSTAGMI